ncbi:polyphosphate kinase 2 [Caulobacter mirabilis]|uniref:ADP/GDP-polyphosphate phosphotransferase n=1 Tax=Caulobacter mirabilis TaxID=69666 RepID=A0A2D2B1U3_9CAUL|nr:polyphosphate kinase 2 [Caulobacter mirabilis]ATQ44220.1 polyphosphate kinase 2 [Caulobacter mirabilis]
MSDKTYDKTLEKLQVALVRWQQLALERGDKVLVIFEGRDAAGKDGSIKRIVEHLSIRATRVVALPKPTETERTQWYFQRYVSHLPAAGELVIFNRSWYNRAGVEPVMGFCTKAEHEIFLKDVPGFEAMLVESGVTVIKLWLDIDKDEQEKRLDARRSDPLKALKVSALDAVAQEKWKDYSNARDKMLMRSSTELTPWVCVRANDKKTARLNIIRQLLQQIAPSDIRKGAGKPDPAVVFPFEAEALGDGRLAR